MATSNRTYMLQNGAHTAGIFSDMTVDGPQIGTLVAIVDRAKNLPNRKTIGKQDPYCAARLGKEAKKTSTDIRGGQTPKWDQELRFTVHDSADYYQLKLSIFTDDKKTDLVGEAWIDLKEIIVPGGGQSDVWQNLSCRGKYAGEIRLEITYYDSRPKPDKPVTKSKQPSTADLDGGSTRQRSPVKRRPLPSDPVTGESPSAPVSTISASTPDLYGPQQTPPRHAKRASHSGFIPNHSPLQSVEYNTPPSRARHSITPYGSSPQSAMTPEHHTPTRSSRLHGERDYESAGHSPYDQPDGRRSYGADMQDHPLRASPRNLPPLDCDEPPPPPPAHRSRHSSVEPETMHRDVSPQKSSMPMRHDVLKSEAHRHTPSTSALPSPYEPYQPEPSPTNPHTPPRYGQSASRQDSYDSVYDPSGRIAQAEELHFDRSPGAGSYSRSPGASPGYMSHAARRRESMQDMDGSGYASSVSPSSRGPSPQKGMNQRTNYRDAYEATRGRSPGGYGVPAPPSSLAHNVDPNLSRDISDRIQEERRFDARYNSHDVGGRGRQWSEPPPSYGGGRGPSPQAFHSPSQERMSSGVTYSGSPHEASGRRPRHTDTSPTPNMPQRIPRKSVSPAPPTLEHRSLSDIPFGPDSYDALNPSMVSSRSSHSAAPSAGSAPPPRDPNGKIIAHDGRKIDPSDHLPMESWAPEPEPRPSSRQMSEDPRSSRPSLSGAQPMPTGNRRTTRSSRPEPIATHQPAQSYDEPVTPASGGRNRLQKKNRGSNAVSPSASSPLAPISPENFQDRQSPYTPTRHAARGSPYDYSNENHAPPHYGSGPPIPGKVPLPIMSGGNGGSLAEEMQRIDIGTGRSRRRGGF